MLLRVRSPEGTAQTGYLFPQLVRAGRFEEKETCVHFPYLWPEFSPHPPLKSKNTSLEIVFIDQGLKTAERLEVFTVTEFLNQGKQGSIKMKWKGGSFRQHAGSQDFHEIDPQNKYLEGSQQRFLPPDKDQHDSYG